MGIQAVCFNFGLDSGSLTNFYCNVVLSNSGLRSHLAAHALNNIMFNNIIGWGLDKLQASFVLPAHVELPHRNISITRTKSQKRRREDLKLG